MSDRDSETGGIWARRAAILVFAGLAALGLYKFNDYSKRSRAAARLFSTRVVLNTTADALTAYKEKAGVFFPPAAEGETPVLDLAYVNQMFLAGSQIKLDEFTIADPFAPVEGGPIHYWSDQNAWLIWSAGPDGDYDLDAFATRSATYDEIASHFNALIYDPTNGVFSSGDIYMTYAPPPPPAP